MLDNVFYLNLVKDIHSRFRTWIGKKNICCRTNRRAEFNENIISLSM